MKIVRLVGLGEYVGVGVDGIDVNPESLQVVLCAFFGNIEMRCRWYAVWLSGPDSRPLSGSYCTSVSETHDVVTDTCPTNILLELR